MKITNDSFIFISYCVAIDKILFVFHTTSLINTLSISFRRQIFMSTIPIMNRYSVKFHNRAAIIWRRSVIINIASLALRGKTKGRDCRCHSNG